MPAIDENDGCDISETCLECPLSVCRFDDVKVYNAYKRRLGGQVCGWCHEPSDSAYCSKEHERLANNKRRRDKTAAKRDLNCSVCKAPIDYDGGLGRYSGRPPATCGKEACVVEHAKRKGVSPLSYLKRRKPQAA